MAFFFMFPLKIKKFLHFSVPVCCSTILTLSGLTVLNTIRAATVEIQFRSVRSVGLQILLSGVNLAQLSRRHREVGAIVLRRLKNEC